MKKYSLLAMSDDELLRQCRFEACRGVGPGGQKRNKTSSAARVTHLESGLSAWDDVTRSQHQNLHHALRKLRWEMAVELRPEDGGGAPEIPLSPVPKQSSPAFCLWLGRIFDALHDAEFQMAPAAERLGCSASQLARLLGKDDLAWQKLAEQRQKRQLPPLHR